MNFIRIYPAPGSDIYDNFFESARTTNRFLYQSLFGHLIFNEGSDPGRIPVVPQIEPKLPAQQGKNSRAELAAAKQQQNAAVKPKDILPISSEDILIEYVRRVATCVRCVEAGSFKQTWRHSILGFVASSGWKSPLDMNLPYLDCHNRSRLHRLLWERLAELRQRREELALKTGGTTGTQYREMELRRGRALGHYSTQELEDFVAVAAKGHVLEFAKHFRDFKGGLLTQINGSLSSRARSQLGKKPMVRPHGEKPHRNPD